MMIAALDPPDFRKRHLRARAELFVQVVTLAEAAGQDQGQCLEA
jgi:hypothetical protein